MVYNNCISSFEELLREDQSLSIHHRNIHCLATEKYKVKKDLTPKLMNEFFEYNEKGEILSSICTHNQNERKSNSKYFQKSYQILGSEELQMQTLQ